MNVAKTSTKILLVTLILLIVSKNATYADGGFPVRPGRLLISPSVSYFFANSQWDSTGVKKNFANNGKYSSIGLNLYAEYGISRRFAIVATAPYVFNNFTQSADPKVTKSQGFSDLETGIRFYLANIDFIYYISLQGTAITPLYHDRPELGYGEEGAEAKLAISGSGHLFGKSTFFNASDGVRQYFGQDANGNSNGPIQNRFSGTFGISLDEDFKNQVSATISGIYSQSNDKSFTPIVESNKDFNFLQASLSYGHSFTNEISLFLTGGRFLTGRNTSVGNIVSLAFIYRLDYR
jgi:hypothetical protein